MFGLWWGVAFAVGGAGVEVADRVVWSEDVTGALNPDEAQERLEEAVGRAPLGTTAVQLHTIDGSGHRTLWVEPEAAPLPEKEDRRRSLAGGVGTHIQGVLSGRAVYLSQCHGWLWSDALDRFATQRGEGYETVEDFHNPEGANQYLIAYLENAGAAVFTARERDMTPWMAIADNDAGGYVEEGFGFVDGEVGFVDAGPWAYGEDPFDTGTTRKFPGNSGAQAIWTPSIERDGEVAVYVTWDASSSHSQAAHYRFTHPGGTFDRWYDQTAHGSTWQYVDTLWLTEGNSLTVTLIGDGDEDAWVSADAVRVGGGMGDVARHGEVTERPRWESSALQYAQFNGAPTTVYDPWGDGWDDDGGSDPAVRSRWADWEHPADEDAVYLSWHSNAFDSVGGEGGSARGTITYYAGGGADAPSSQPAECSYPAVDGSYTLSSLIQDEMVDVFESQWEPGWLDRGVGTACFSEVSPSHNDEMPSALVELAFHDNGDDAWYLKHPQFRQDASRAMARGVVRYFMERDGLVPVYAPEPPTHVSLTHDHPGVLTARWAEGPSGAHLGDPATGYQVETSLDGRSWSEGTPVTGTEADLTIAEGLAVYVRVRATNAGGRSQPSPVVGARRTPEGSARVLIVDGFDRLDSGLLHRVTPHSSLGEVVHMNLTHMNPGHAIVEHGLSVGAAGYYFDGALDEALDSLDLEAYDLVIWGAGEESTVDESISHDQQRALRSYMASGGALFLSGAEVLWDLDANGDEEDRAFVTEVLQSWMASDDSGTDDVEPEGILAGIPPLDFGWSRGGLYPVEWADVLDSDHDVIARYGTGEVAGVLGPQIGLLGFPFETVADPLARDELMARVLPELLPGYVPPEVEDSGSTDVGVTDPSTTGAGGDLSDSTAGDPGAPVDGSDRQATPDAGGCGCAVRGLKPVPWMLYGLLWVWCVRRESRGHVRLS